MRRPRWRLHLLLLLAVSLLPVLAVPAVYVTLDPFDEFGWRSPNRPVHAHTPLTAIRLTERLERAPHSLVFGTSRTQQISSELMGEPLLNLHTVYGNPRDIVRFLQSLPEAARNNIVRIYVLADLQTFERTYLEPDIDFRATPIERAVYRMRKFSAVDVVGLVREFGRMIRGAPYRLADDGALVPDQIARFAGAVPTLAASYAGLGFAHAPNLASIQRFAEAIGRPVLFFTPTLSRAFVEAAGCRFFDAYRRAVTQAVGDVRDLLYVPGISDNNALFVDESHLNRDGLRKLLPLLRADASGPAAPLPCEKADR